MFESLDSLEAPWVRRAAGLSRNPVLRFGLVSATRFADGWGLILVIPTVALTMGNRGAAGVLAGVLSGLVLALAIHGLKLVLRRDRPQGVDVVRPLLAPDLHSFPSGHTAHSFSVMVAAAWAHPAFAIALVPISLAVGLSRVALGLHYPSDVIAGALVGSAFGALTLWGMHESGLLGLLLRFGPMG